MMKENTVKIDLKLQSLYISPFWYLNNEAYPIWILAYQKKPHQKSNFTVLKTESKYWNYKHAYIFSTVIWFTSSIRNLESS